MQRLPALGALNYERHRPEPTELYRLVQAHAASFFAQVEDASGVGLPKFVRDEFEACACKVYPLSAIIHL